MALILFFHLLAVLTLASGKPILIPRLGQEVSQDDAQPFFDVMLESLGNTSVKAQVTNVGTQGVRVVQRGGILDHVPTKKVTVHGGDSDPTFTGVRVEYILSHLSAEGFIQISPNQTVESVFDIADLYALSPGQEYTAIADGVIEYTALTNQTKFHSFSYKSNTISFTAPTDVPNRLEDRATLVCTDEYNSLVQDAISRAAEMATAAAADARTGSALFQKFFKSTSQADMDNVAGRLDAIANEATTAGQLTYYCEPTEDDYCAGNVAAMMYPTLNKVVNCPGYYTSTKVSNYCNYLDQAAITLHEFAHADAVYSPGTEDIAYGYEGVLALDTDQALLNADSFAYYASAVYLQCAADDSITIGTPLVNTGVNSSSTVDINISTKTDTSTTTTETDTPTPIAITTITTTITATATLQSTTTTTTTTTTTANPTPTPTTGTIPDTGSDPWPWGGGFGEGHHHSSDDDTNPTGTLGGGSETSSPASSGTAVPVTTSSGDNLFTLQDLLDWLMAQYSGQTQTETDSSNSDSVSG
ncbi:Deuterolysin metalloprotease family-domain-containing protein [Aspergillus cavernicola]|uniref:Neutral protease 2 n=1 Tax=Aspergillus cavernicola TaxID=176166 RepID=A0ABR4I1X4_9EURO